MLPIRIIFALLFGVSLFYIRSPRITQTLPQTETDMNVGYYLLSKPVKIDVPTVQDVTFVDNGSLVEVTCNYATLLPTGNNIRVYYDGRTTQCINKSWKLPQPFNLPALPRLDSSSISVGSVNGLPIRLVNGKLNLVQVNASSESSSALLTTQDGQAYDVTMRQSTKGIYHSVVIKNRQVTSMYRVRPLLPAEQCPAITNQLLPAGLVDMRLCFKFNKL